MTSLLAAALPVLLMLQVGPNPAPDPLPSAGEMMRDRPAREANDPPAPERQSRLSQCLLRAGSDAQGALDYAQAWREMAVSDLELAQGSHCAGLALVRQDRFGEARQAFVSAREDMGDGNPAYRARLGGMAGNAALAGGDAEGALPEFQRAEDDAAASGNAGLRAGFAVDRARALVSLKRPEDAAAALASAREIDPANARAWLLSATLSRRLERLGEAQRQIEYAAELAPRDPAVGLEAGVIAAMAGREADARASFNSVVRLAPDSAEAASARTYLAQLGSAPVSE